MQHKFPFVSFADQMTGNDLDVNVHPRKLEVRFARGREVYDAIYEAVHNALLLERTATGCSSGKGQGIKGGSSKPRSSSRAI